MLKTNSTPDPKNEQPMIPIADALRITEIVQAIDAWWMPDTRVRLRNITPIEIESDFDYVIEVTIHVGYHKARPISIAIDTSAAVDLETIFTEMTMHILHRAAYGEEGSAS